MVSTWINWHMNMVTPMVTQLLGRGSQPLTEQLRPHQSPVHQDELTKVPSVHNSCVPSETVGETVGNLASRKAIRIFHELVGSSSFSPKIQTVFSYHHTMVSSFSIHILDVHHCNPIKYGEFLKNGGSPKPWVSIQKRSNLGWFGGTIAPGSPWWLQRGGTTANQLAVAVRHVKHAIGTWKKTASCQLVMVNLKLFWFVKLHLN